MNLLSHIRRLRWAPRAALAIFVLAMIQTTVLPCVMAAQSLAEISAAIPEHCVYCPPGHAADSTPDSTPGSNRNCAFPQAVTVDVYAASAQHVAMLLHSSLWQSAPFDLCDLRQAQVFLPAVFTPPPERPHTLTHCVQLK